MRHARVSRWIPALLAIAACGPFREAPVEGDPIREDDEVTPASAVYADDGDATDAAPAEPTESDADAPAAPEEPPTGDPPPSEGEEL